MYYYIFIFNGNIWQHKNPDKQTCIDYVILTYVPPSFHSTCVLETRWSDFHLITLTVLRKSVKKSQPTLITSYKNYYKNLSNDIFRENLLYRLSRENLVNNDDSFQNVFDIGLEMLNRHASCKKKHAQGNQVPFFNKELLMIWSRLLNAFLQNKSKENKKNYLQNKEIIRYKTKK